MNANAERRGPVVASAFAPPFLDAIQGDGTLGKRRKVEDGGLAEGFGVRRFPPLSQQDRFADNPSAWPAMGLLAFPSQLGNGR